MEPVDLKSHCKQRFGKEAPDLAQLVHNATNHAELAFLTLTARETLASEGTASTLVHLGFKEAVRDRYRELVEAGLTGKPR